VPLVCLPLVATDEAALLAQAAELVSLAPDLIEWRCDKFEPLDTPQPALEALQALRRAIGDIPLIFTCRVGSEGGFQEIDAQRRLRLNLAAIASGRIDVIDTELSGGAALIEPMRQACRQAGVTLILSYHDFERTPAEAAILERLVEAERQGADIAKVALMPRDHLDVLALLAATYKARSAAVRTPLITMSMGGLGAITRIAGGLFGSDVSFAIGSQSSAPGQIPIAELRQAWRALGFA
jgi:3-dehydroquinate dehydratase-1